MGFSARNLSLKLIKGSVFRSKTTDLAKSWLVAISMLLSPGSVATEPS